MTGRLHIDMREEGFRAMLGQGAAASSHFTHTYEVSLLSGGAELSGNGYARVLVAVGSLWTRNWSRSGSTITVETVTAHGLVTGDTIVIEASSDNTAVPPSATETVTVVDGNTFTFVGVASGGTSGTVSFFPKPFWLVEAEGTDGLKATQLVDIAFGAASGGEWRFDEIRLHKYLQTGGHIAAFPLTGEIAVNDGDDVVIPAGTLVIYDVSPSVTS